MFNLENKYVILTTLTTRTEGADVPAISLRCEISMNNDVLNDFAPGLLQSFYEKHEKERVELIKNDMLPDLKFQKMKKFSWDEEFENVRVKIMEEIDQDTARFIFAESTIKNFKFELKQGGSVVVQFTINCKPEGAAVGWLYSRQKQQMPITLEAGEAPQLEGFEDVETVEVEDNAEYSRAMLSPKADMIATFINDNPGKEALDVSNHFQLSIKKAEAVLNELIAANMINQVLKGYFPVEVKAQG